MQIYYDYPQQFPKELATCGVRNLFFRASSPTAKRIDIKSFLTLHFPYECNAIIFTELTARSFPDMKMYPSFGYYDDTNDLEKMLSNCGILPKERRKLFIHNMPKGKENQKAQAAFIQYCVRKAVEYDFETIAVGINSMTMAMDNGLDGVVVDVPMQSDRGDVFLLNGSRFFCHGGPEHQEDFREKQMRYGRKFLREVGFTPEELIDDKPPFSKRRIASIKAWEFAAENWTKTRHLRVKTFRKRPGQPSEPERIEKLPILLPEGQDSEYGMEWDEDEGVAVSPAEGGESLSERKQRLKEEATARRKRIMEQRSEGIICDYCVILEKCDQARPGHVCAKQNGFSALAKQFNTTNAQQILEGLKVVIVQLAERNQAAMELERREGFVLKEVTEQQKALFDMGMKMAKMLDPKLGAADAGVVVNITNNTRIQAAQFIKELSAGGEVSPQVIAQAIQQLREQQERQALIPAQQPEQEKAVIEVRYEEKGTE